MPAMGTPLAILIPSLLYSVAYPYNALLIRISSYVDMGIWEGAILQITLFVLTVFCHGQSSRDFVHLCSPSWFESHFSD